MGGARGTDGGVGTSGMWVWASSRSSAGGATVNIQAAFHFHFKICYIHTCETPSDRKRRMDVHAVEKRILVGAWHGPTHLRGCGQLSYMFGGPQDTFFILCDSDEESAEENRFSSRQTYSCASRLSHMIFYLNALYARPAAGPDRGVSRQRVARSTVFKGRCFSYRAGYLLCGGGDTYHL